MLDECWSSVPSSLFLGFSEMVLFPSVGIGILSLSETGDAARLYTLIFSSDPPVAR